MAERTKAMQGKHFPSNDHTTPTPFARKSSAAAPADCSVFFVISSHHLEF
jgi:hypothetical protein